ncbi:MAG: hypothetical protein C5B48_10560 [Candidatus Rokuibacteriota bacterium]|nr:MAG: hypothetical protein C5B48_10560 [Candidatus Rokubacteria bacterium]
MTLTTPDAITLAAQAVESLSTNGHYAPEPAYVFNPALPSDHFVSRFIDYAKECVDAAHDYFETIALILLATATPGIRARLRQYPRGLPTAFYAILIGDSTRSRKSSSAGLGLDLVNEVFPDCRLAEQASPEAFIEQLATRGHESSVWYVDEIGETLDKLHHAKYLAGTRGLLLELYEGRPYRYKRTTKKTRAGTSVTDEMVIERPHLSVIGATTPSIFEIVTARDVSSGFMARFAVVMPTSKPPRRGLEEPTADILTARDQLTSWLHAIHLWAKTTTPRVVFAGDALAIIDRFAEAIETSTALENERSRAMLQRLNAMTVKLAMLAAAGQPGITQTDRSDLIVTPQDATAAVAIGARWRDYAVAFGERVGETELERLVDRALRVIRQKGICPRQIVAKQTHVEKRTLDRIEETLADRGEIIVTIVESTRGPDSKVWTAVTR